LCDDLLAFLCGVTVPARGVIEDKAGDVADMANSLRYGDTSVVGSL
jgi:hypothetical protein